MDKPTPEEIQKFDRWFAIETNNACWDLISKPDRTAEDDQEMLWLACTAAYHWSRAGTPLNRARAEHVLARVHALLDHRDLAQTYAERYLLFCEANPCEDWDRAFAHAELANVAALVNDSASYEKHHALATSIGNSIRNPEDRKVFFEEFARIASI